MNEERIKCFECDNMILPSTGQKNNGLCAQCSKNPKHIRDELRDRQSTFAEALKSGSFFLPSHEETTTAVALSELEPIKNQWIPYPEYYKSCDDKSIVSIFDRAIQASKGKIVLLAESGTLLVLVFNSDYGSIEYRNEEAETYRIAYTTDNASSQVEKSLQLWQVCPCCGVELLCYPSRFHIPRARAFEIVTNIVSGAPVSDVQWYDPSDFTYTEPGLG